MERQLEAMGHAQHAALGHEQTALATAIERLQAEARTAAESMHLENGRHRAQALEALESQKAESRARLDEDQQHRARVHQAELGRFDRAVVEMGAKLGAEREAAREREGRLRGSLEQQAKSGVATAWAHAQAEHERVLGEAEAHAAQLASQHEAALAAALAQKDGQLGQRLEEYEGQLARLADEGAELQRRTQLAIRQAGGACDGAKRELQAAQGAAEGALREALGALHAQREEATAAAHERVLQQERASHALALGALEGGAERDMRATLSSLDDVRQESNARHAAGAAGLAAAVAALHAARETELRGVGAEHTAALARLRDEYERQLSRAHKLSEETWAALRAHGEQTLEEERARHATQLEALEREKAAVREETTAGWAHLPLPELLRQAMEEGIGKLRESHAQQLASLEAEHAAAIDRSRRDVALAQAQAEEAVSKQAELSAAETEMAKQAATLEAEQRRARALDALNAKTEEEVRALREEQVQILRQRLEEEAARIKAEERARVAAEQATLRQLSSELEHDLHFAEAARHAMGVNANEAMADEIERLAAELKATRAAKAKGPAAAKGGSKPAAAPRPAPAPPARPSDRPTPKGGAQSLLTPSSKPAPKTSGGSNRPSIGAAGRGKPIKA